MTDLSKRANLHGRREVRGLVLPTFDASFSPTQVVESEWAPLVRSDVESEDSEFWRFIGQASLVDHPYTVRDQYGEFQEVMRGGSWDTTLTQNPDVMHNYMHDPLTTMSTTRGGGLTLTASPNLDVRSLIPRTDVDGQRFMPKVQRGDASSMSFAFRVTHQTWNDDYTEREITGVNMHGGDVASIVSGLGASPPAWGTVRSADPLEGLVQQLRAGTPEHVNAVAVILNGMIGTADDAASALLEALGIPEPGEDPAVAAMDGDVVQTLAAEDPEEVRYFLERYAKARSRALVA